MGTIVALVVLFGPLGFLKHDKNAKIKRSSVSRRALKATAPTRQRSAHAQRYRTAV